MSRTPAQEALASELGEAAWLADPDAPVEFARSLDERLNDPGRLQAAREAAWTLGRTRFNWDVEQKLFLSTIQNSLQSSPAIVP